ncbi:MAG TPA: hypothetical protein VEK07_18820 [Polyangiaceae bacterium]|nr:hypothetical protein [Polyangiaceae bacterium]
MNLTAHARSIHPNAQGWVKLSRSAEPVFQAPAPPFQLVVGAGAEAEFLSECLQALVVPPLDPARELGWQPPPAARIRVALEGRRDSDWSLEADETKF